MPDLLRLQISSEDDGTAELSVTVEANGFSGHGSAWINIDQLVRLGFDLRQAFPLAQKLELNGGYWRDSTPAKLSQEHLAIAVYPVAGRGVVGCQVRLACPILDDDRPESRRCVETELLTSYEELRRFADSVGELATGKTPEAILRAVDV